MTVAAVTREPVESNHKWSKKLDLPYPLLSDEKGEAAAAFCVVRHIKLAAWTFDMHRRVTFLIDPAGEIGAVWERVKVRGHAAQVLAVAKVAGRSS